MSDIKRVTFISSVFDHVVAVLYTIALNKYKDRLLGSERGSEERANEAIDIVRNLGFFMKLLCHLAYLLDKVSFFFMVDIDEQQAKTIIAEEKAASEDKE